MMLPDEQTATTADLYRDFYAGFSSERYERFCAGMEAVAGHRYRLSTTPYFLTAARFERLAGITEAMLRLVQTERYQTMVTGIPWFLPQRPLAAHDFFGDVEFHIDAEGEHVIEMNIGQPGHAGFLEALEREFLAAFPIDGAAPVNDTFEREIVRAATADGAFTRVAVAVNHTQASARYLPHYRYYEQIFARFGVEARVVFARDVHLDADGYPTWDGVRYDRIFTLVIPRIWEDHQEEFAEYTRAYLRRPEMFFVNPSAWTAASKRLLPVCWNLSRDSFGLDAADVRTILGAAIESYMLSDFTSADEIVERFGDTRNIVLKALENYHGKGLVLRPSYEELARLLARDAAGYVVQRFTPAGTIPTIASDGSVNHYLFSLRIGFVNGTVLGVRGYNFTLPTSEEDLVPVVVVG